MGVAKAIKPLFLTDYRSLPFVYYAKPDKVNNPDLTLIPIKVGQLHRGDEVFTKDGAFIGTIKNIRCAKHYWNLKFSFKELRSKKFGGIYQRQCWVLIRKEKENG